jgi:hypothetical protein
LLDGILPIPFKGASPLSLVSLLDVFTMSGRLAPMKIPDFFHPTKIDLTSLGIGGSPFSCSRVWVRRNKARTPWAPGTNPTPGETKPAGGTPGGNRVNDEVAATRGPEQINQWASVFRCLLDRGRNALGGRWMTSASCSRLQKNTNQYYNLQIRLNCFYTLT